MENYKKIFDEYAIEVDRRRRVNDHPSANNEIGFIFEGWSLFDNQVHEDMHIPEVKEFHDRTMDICAACEEESEGTSSFKEFDFSMPYTENGNFYLYTSFMIFFEGGRYYNTIGSGRHTFASVDNPCVSCKRTGPACLSIPHVTTGEIIIMCADFWRNT